MKIYRKNPIEKRHCKNCSKIRSHVTFCMISRLLFFKKPMICVKTFQVSFIKNVNCMLWTGCMSCWPHMCIVLMIYLRIEILLLFFRFLPKPLDLFSCQIPNHSLREMLNGYEGSNQIHSSLCSFPLESCKDVTDLIRSTSLMLVLWQVKKYYFSVPIGQPWVYYKHWL